MVMPNSREQFEAAYRKAYPITCELVPDVFAVEYDEYTRTPVQVGWVMWQAGAAAEREICAKICDKAAKHWTLHGGDSFEGSSAAESLAAEIRDRSAP